MISQLFAPTGTDLSLGPSFGGDVQARPQVEPQRILDGGIGMEHRICCGIPVTAVEKVV